MTTDVKTWQAEAHHHLLRPGDDAFPAFLDDLRDAPEQLFIVGDVDALHLPALAIVGSRNPTRGGERTAYEFARHLASAGFCIVSGLAQGIDAAAHRGAIDGGGKTVAFLGHGVDSVYPASNTQLAASISGAGCLASEYPLGATPRRGYFPARNRLISGLSLGTLVVEAAQRSGSLITARLAAEQGREVFAIPGSIHNPMAKGCHRLIRDGAKLVETADDIVSEIAPLAAHLGEQLQNDTEAATTPVTRQDRSDTQYVKLLDSLGHDPVSVDELIARSGLTAAEVSSMLLILEMDGTVEKNAGGHYVLLS